MATINFAKNLKRIREMRGMSKEELGRRVGVSGVTVGYWEEGRNEPLMGKIELIAKALNVTLDELIFEKKPENEDEIVEQIKNASEERREAIRAILSLPEEDLKIYINLMKLHLGKKSD